ncbi:alpha/beta fold hydrolase [Gordonia hydrophobica]|uniref:DUF3141 domain-containing protein n=1 Tax=Gordonia hydrophobica TaxID=40516 RepID=A0ABZ2U3U1_9ACTN|nr:alpha/beta fold hydrolase [Gordonia hydrophobica]MBM7367967.1 poly(3-hydroxyalkanoate) synthetase [Gordonia hydrophobica]
MNDGTTATSQLQRWAQAPTDLATAWIKGWTDYSTAALRSGPFTPMQFLSDATRWAGAATVRSKPGWTTPHSVVRTWPQARLLDFSAPTADPAEIPIVFLPPQGGHASTIVDYSADQSQVRTALDAGIGRVFSIDYLPATAETKDITVDDYVAMLDDVVGQVGGAVHLVGDCQGGWLAAIYAALRPHAVRSLALGGAPIDTHAGDSAVAEWLTALTRHGDIAAYRVLVAAGDGRHLGANQVLGFKMLEPTEEFNRLCQLWGNIRDPEYVERYDAFTNWFEHGQDMPGAFYLWVVEHLFHKNELIAGTLEVQGTVVDLAAIDAPLYLIAGERDHITPPPQMLALADAVSTPADDIRTWTLDAGHLGLFMGHTALSEPWTEIFTDLARRHRESAAADAASSDTASENATSTDAASAHAESADA